MADQVDNDCLGLPRFSAAIFGGNAGLRSAKYAGKCRNAPIYAPISLRIFVEIAAFFGLKTSDNQIRYSKQALIRCKSMPI